MGGLRRRVGSGAVVAVLALSACSGSDAAEADPSGVAAGDSADATASNQSDSLQPTTAVSSTVASETRTVPTVPPSTLPGQVQVDTTEPGVINASPTIVPEQPAPVDPDAPATTQAPPTTELIGDPQPSPDTTAAPPPPTVAPPPPACERLIDFGVDGVIADNAGNTPTSDNFAVGGCRFDSGTIVAEVYFVPQATIRNDWYQRDGIEPVGEVSGDAVGLSSFVPPSSPAGDGYTIALVGGREGVIVAVRGTSDARLVAGQIAIFANQAA